MRFTQGSLSLKEKSRLEQASRLASMSTCRFKHGAVIVKGGRVLAVGVNAYTSSLSLTDILEKEGRSIHAEAAAIKAMGGSAKGATIYVARINRLGEPRMSKPCNACMKLIKEAEIKKVVYTIEHTIDVTI